MHYPTQRTNRSNYFVISQTQLGNYNIATLAYRTKTDTMKMYTSEYPSNAFDPAFKRFFEDFYAISDNPDANNEYVESFTSDATLIMASKKAQGSEGMVSMTF